MSNRERIPISATRLFAVIALALTACDHPVAPRIDKPPPPQPPRVLDADVRAAISLLENPKSNAPVAVAYLVCACRREPSVPLAGPLLYRALSDGLADGIPQVKPVTIFPHEGDVRSAVFSPDESRVLAVADDNAAHIWEVASGQAIGQPLKHEGRVRSAAFSPDGKRIVTGGDISSYAELPPGHSGLDRFGR